MNSPPLTANIMPVTNAASSKMGMQRAPLPCSSVSKQRNLLETMTLGQVLLKEA